MNELTTLLQIILSIGVVCMGYGLFFTMAIIGSMVDWCMISIFHNVFSFLVE